MKFTARERPADGRPGFVEGAKARNGIQGHARAVGVLVHAADAFAYRDQGLGHAIVRLQLHHEMAAAPAAGAGGKEVWFGWGNEGNRRSVIQVTSDL